VSQGKIIFGVELVAALEKRLYVKYIAVGQPAAEITQKQALALLAAHLCQGKVNRAGRLMHTREIPRQFQASDCWVKCFRTADAPIIQPSPEWFQEMGY
jgi:hypothetical protein